MTLSEKIIFFRKKQNWSQEELAEHMGVSRQSVSKWESGVSVPELDRIVMLCRLFDVTADTLIRDDLDPDGVAMETGDGTPLLTLQDAYAYAADCRIAAQKIALGAAACTASPALLVALSGISGLLCTALGLPAMFLLIAWAVWLFIHAGIATGKYRYIEKGRFRPLPETSAWVRTAQNQFHPVLTRSLAFGVVLCVFSPAMIMAGSGLGGLLFGRSGMGACFGVGGMLAVIAAGVYLIVHSSTVQSGYKKLLKTKNA